MRATYSCTDNICEPGDFQSINFKLTGEYLSGESL